MPLQATSGAASYDAFGGGVPVVPNYIEEVFSCFLYTGSSSSLPITNNIDLLGKGGMVWLKNRNAGFNNRNYVMDSARGNNSTGYNRIITDLTNAQNLGSISTFNSNGFTLLGGGQEGNENGMSTVSWTFRKQPKFFDVVTYTGNGVSGRAIPHNLGSAPGCVIVKRTDTTGDWFVNHFVAANLTERYLFLNSTSQADTGTIVAGGYVSNLSSTVFSTYDFGTGMANVNASGGTYVAYLFAHNAGGFGLTGTDNVISCGSFTTDGSGDATVNLGYEPQWVMMKVTNDTQDWILNDTMRGMPTKQIPDAGGNCQNLFPNTSGAESVTGRDTSPTSTGFIARVGSASKTYIYIAIRRGPMKVPTTGTSVFSLDASFAGGSGGVLGAITASDLVINSQRDPAANSPFVFVDRLRGVGQPNTGATTRALYSHSTAAETTVDSTSASSLAQGVNGANLTSSAGLSSAIRTVQQGPGGSVAYNMRRAPGFFDEVCYTGNSAASNNQNHNLGVVPEMCILKARSGVFAADNWQVVHKNDGVTAKTTALNLTNATLVDSVMSANFTSTFFKTADATWPFTRANFNGDNYVAYLFATCPGVSKVGSYTGTGATQVINCGFTAGSRFIMIKRTDSTGNWYVWDSARGIVAGNDPYLLLNSTAAEVTNTDFVDTAAVGFEISSTAPAEINASGGNFLFLAIA